MICCAISSDWRITMKLKELRKKNGVTQKEIAHAIGCSEMAYSRYENGKREPDIQTICLLAKYFGTSTDEIIGYSSKNTPQ